jgi:8-oxo-dGTP pyrophosphatase MutT (NUDIX family)
VLVHHAKLDKWVQPGGHCDGEADVLSVAVREAQEETGLAITPVDNNIFDIDVHRIPEYWNTPEHWHFDVRFLLQADDEHAPQASSESRAVRWVSLDEAAQLNSSQSIIRMITKTRQRFTSTKLVHPQKQGAMH